MSSGKSSVASWAQSGALPAPIMLCAASTIALSLWIVTVVLRLLVPLNQGILKDRGHTLLTVQSSLWQELFGPWLARLCCVSILKERKVGRGISYQCRKTHGFLFSSPELDTDDEEGDTGQLLEAPSPTVENEAYLTISSTSEGQLLCEECLEADSGTIPLPQFCSWHALSESWPAEEACDSESDWEDLEEAVDPDEGTLRLVSLWVA